MRGVRTQGQKGGQACCESGVIHRTLLYPGVRSGGAGEQVAESGLFTLIRCVQAATLSSFRHLQTSEMTSCLQQVAFIFPDEDES